LSGSQYRLNPQNPFSFNGSFAFSGGETILSTNSFEKDLYITQVVFSTSRTGGVWSALNQLVLAVESKDFLIMCEPDFAIVDFNFNYEFYPAIKVKKGDTIKIIFSAARNANDLLCLNFYGWEE